MMTVKDRLRFLFRNFKARYRDQKIELREIRRQLRPGDTVCDIGANKGSYLYWFSRWCREGRVVAFEPQPLLADYLTAVCRDFPLRNVTVESKAAYSKSGTQDLFTPGDRSPGASLSQRIAERGEHKVIPVTTVALDDYFGANERIALLKIDVEGAELDVFKGATRILRESSPLLVFECEDRHLYEGAVMDVLAYLKGFGYGGGFVSRGELRPLSEFDAAIHQRRDNSDFWNGPDYANNFILSKRG